MADTKVACLFDELTCRCVRRSCATHPRPEDADRAATDDEIRAAFSRDAGIKKPERLITIEELKTLSLEELLRR